MKSYTEHKKYTEYIQKKKANKIASNQIKSNLYSLQEDAK